MKPLLLAVLMAGLVSAPALAEEKPPQGSLPLSAIAAKVEQRQDFLAFNIIDFDNDRYEIRYWTVGGKERKIYIDPRTGNELKGED